MLDWLMDSWTVAGGVFCFVLAADAVFRFFEI